MNSENKEPRWDQKAQKALTRMKNAYEAGKGVRLSWEELEVMNRTSIGQIWHEDEAK